jgi:NitT/TauT family transport system ATP-binding protein
MALRTVTDDEGTRSEGDRDVPDVGETTGFDARSSRPGADRASPTEPAPPVTATSSRAATPTGETFGVDELLSVQQVRICYRLRRQVVTAVESASFAMQRHERLMLIGPSGCGKSTLLKAIAGFLPVSGGTITFDGRTDLTPGPDRAVVFQEFDQLFPWRTVLENVAYPLRVIGRDREAARSAAEHFLEMTGLTAAIDRHPHELSGGMKQRVAIARALALEPTMLLMDEPFGSLDAITRARLQRELKAIAERTRVAVLFVTHSILEAMTLGDRVVVLGPPPSHVMDVVDVRDVGGPGDARYVEAQAHLHQLLGATDEDLTGVEG